MSSDDFPTLDRPRKATSGMRVPPTGWFCRRHSVAVQSLRGRCVWKNWVADARSFDVGGTVSQYHDRELAGLLVPVDWTLVAWKERRRDCSSSRMRWRRRFLI